jgi:hypothetical protein
MRYELLANTSKYASALQRKKKLSNVHGKNNMNGTYLFMSYHFINFKNYNLFCDDHNIHNIS